MTTPYMMQGQGIMGQTLATASNQWFQQKMVKNFNKQVKSGIGELEDDYYIKCQIRGRRDWFQVPAWVSL